MDLENLVIDPTVMEHGVWVKGIPGCGDLELHVRPMDNPDYRAMMAEEMANVSRDKRINGRVIPEEQDRIQLECVLSKVLLGWKNLHLRGKELDYSPSLARQLLSEKSHVRFRDAVAWAAREAAEKRSEDDEDLRKNSSQQSSGNSVGQASE